jgi:hypothetical protein
MTLLAPGTRDLRGRLTPRITFIASEAGQSQQKPSPRTQSDIHHEWKEFSREPAALAGFRQSPHGMLFFLNVIA